MVDGAATLGARILDLASREGRGSGDGNERKQRFCTTDVSGGIKQKGRRGESQAGLYATIGVDHERLRHLIFYVRITSN